MKQVFVLALALSVALCGLDLRAEDKDGKTPTIKDVMKAHKKGGARMKATDLVKAEKWDEAAPVVKSWVTLAEALAKNEPSVGGKDSWEKQSADYVKAVKSVAKAVEDKDAKAGLAALGVVGKTCGACHGVHNPPKKKG